MGKRVYEVAEELGVEAKQIVLRLKESGVDVKDHLSSLSKEEEDLAKNFSKKQSKQRWSFEGSRVAESFAAESGLNQSSSPRLLLPQHQSRLHKPLSQHLLLRSRARHLSPLLELKCPLRSWLKPLPLQNLSLQ